MLEIVTVTYPRLDAEYILIKSIKEYENYGQELMDRPDVIVTSKFCSVKIGNNNLSPMEVKNILIASLKDYEGFENIEQNPEIDIKINDNFISKVEIKTYCFKAKKIKEI